jgi:hypothetical protein
MCVWSRHPVLNDKDMAYWSAVGATSWPTLALVSPKGTLLSIWAGIDRQYTHIS